MAEPPDLLQAIRTQNANFLKDIYYLAKEKLPEKLQSYFLYHRVSCGSSVERREVACPYCFTTRSSSNSSWMVRPTRQPGAAMLRIQRKIKMGRKLSAVEKKLAMRASKNNAVVITCQVCRKKTTINTPKPQPIVDVPVIDLPAKKKKKKKQSSSVADKTPDCIILDDSDSDETPSQPTVIQNLSQRQKKNRKSKNQNMSVSFSGCTMITIDDAKGSQLSQATPSTSRMNFIPLVASTPLVASKNYKVQVTPLRAERSAKKKKRQNALQNMLAAESMKKPARSSLKGFLNSL